MNHPAWYFILTVLFLLSLALRYELLFFFALLLALASVASQLWMRYCLENVTYRRTLSSTRLNFGEEAELTIEVTNAKILPLAWLMALDSFPPEVTLLTRRPNEEIPRRLLVDLNDRLPVRLLSNMMALRWYERVRRTYRIRGDQRGVFQFGPADLVSGDVFGFYWRTAEVPETDTLLVYPKVVPVSQLGLPPAWPLPEEKAAFRLIEDPLRMATVREYVPGDSYRYIHWKATARMRQLQTKVFDPGASRVLYLFVDVQTSQNPYGIVPEYLELIISAAASIATHTLSSHQVVALYANSGSGDASSYVHVPSSRSPAQLPVILETLARIDPFRQISLSRLLWRCARTLPYGATVVAISSLESDEILKALIALQDTGRAVVLLTVGERPIQAPANMTVYHLGGRDAWNALATLKLA